MPKTFLTEQAKWFPEGSLAEIPADPTDGGAAALRWALEPGDAIAFHMLALHRSHPSKT